MHILRLSQTRDSTTHSDHLFSANCPSTQGHPPEHHRFKDKRIPEHITYAYKRAATIIKNEDFYQLPDNGTYTIDLLFLMSNAPVATASFPEAGSESYVGLANAMELAMDELSTMFPEMLRGETKSSNRCEVLHMLKQQHSIARVIYNCG